MGYSSISLSPKKLVKKSQLLTHTLIHTRTHVQAYIHLFNRFFGWDGKRSCITTGCCSICRMLWQVWTNERTRQQQANISTSYTYYKNNNNNNNKNARSDRNEQLTQLGTGSNLHTSIFSHSQSMCVCVLHTQIQTKWPKANKKTRQQQQQQQHEEEKAARKRSARDSGVQYKVHTYIYVCNHCQRHKYTPIHVCVYI